MPFPQGARLPPAQRTTPARKSVRCGPEDSPPRPQPPGQTKTGSGPRSPAPRTGSWGRESAQAQTAHREARRSRGRAALLQLPLRTTPARKRVRCGVGDGSQRLHSLRPRNAGSGPSAPAPRTGSWRRESAQLWMCIMEAQAPPPPGCPPAASTAHNGRSQERTLWGCDGFPRVHPTHSRKTGSAPRPPARRTGGWGRESARPQTPLTERKAGRHGDWATPSPRKAGRARDQSGNHGGAWTTWNGPMGAPQRDVVRCACQKAR